MGDSNPRPKEFPKLPAGFAKEMKTVASIAKELKTAAGFAKEMKTMASIAKEFPKLPADFARELKTAASIAKEFTKLPAPLEALHAALEETSKSESFDSPRLDDLTVSELTLVFDSTTLEGTSGSQNWHEIVLNVAREKLENGLISQNTFRIIFHFLCLLLISIFGPKIGDYLFPERDVPARPAIEMFREANINLNINFYPQPVPSDVMIASRETAVYHRPRGRSTLVGGVRVGDQVKVLDQKKEWRKIVWTKQSGAEAEGWIQAEYIRRPKPLSQHYLRTSNEAAD